MFTRIREVRRPHEAHLLGRGLVAGDTLRHLRVELPCARTIGLGRPPEDLLVELGPAAVPDGPERIDSEHPEHASRPGLRDVEGEVAAPRVADDVRLVPAERVEHTARVVHVGCDRVGVRHRPSRRRRMPASIVPHAGRRCSRGRGSDERRHSGGVDGRGPNGATQTNYNYLPEHATDFVFASTAEQRGFLGVTVLLLLYLLVIWRAIKVITLARDAFSAIAAVVQIAVTPASASRSM